MPKKLTEKQEKILQILRELGGKATAREIAQKNKSCVFSVSQSLTAIARNPEYFSKLYQEGRINGDNQWHLE